MKSGLQGRTDRRHPVLVAVAVAAGAAALGLSVFGGGTVERPARPGGDLAEQLDALRGANDLVRATRADVGRDPALYPTAYGRLEAALESGRRGGAAVPGIRPDALADLARTDVLDTPAWRAHYVCLAMAATKESIPASTGSKGSKGANGREAVDGPAVDAATVLERAGLRKRAVREALGYLRAPDGGDDLLTSLATRAAFLRTLTCLGRDGEVSRAALNRLAADTARADQPVPVLYAAEALRAVGLRARATRAVRGADALLKKAGCTGLDPIQRAALVLLRDQPTAPTRQTRDCLVPSLEDSDTQTRWLVRRALMSGDDGTRSVAPLPAPVGHIRSDGLVAKSPTQLGTLTATYNAARALTASARQEHTPYWLVKRLKQLGSGVALDSSDRVLLAMTCHRLSLRCGPQAEKGVEEAAESKVPARLSAENQRGWYGAMAARAEFGLGCRRTSVELAEGVDEGDGRSAALSARSLRVVVVLADAGCAAQAERLTEGTDLVAQARKALRDGDLLTASDAVQAALVSDQSVPQELWDELPGLLERYRDAKFPDLYAASPGGTASADATRAAYYLLA